MEVFVLGRGGHAKVVSDVIEQAGGRVAGYVVADSTAGRFLGREVFEEERFIESHRGAALVIAVGDNAERRRVYLRIGEGFSYPAFVHPAAVVSRSVAIGPGTVVMAGAVINAEALVGRLCVINSRAVVEHECCLEDYVSIAPGASVCGACRLNEGCYVGAGATVIQGMRLGGWSLIGAGAVVCTAVEADSLVTGVPAKPRT